MTDSLHDRLQALYDRLKSFPEASRCEHGVHLKRDAYVAFLDLRQLIEREVLPALASKERTSAPWQPAADDPADT
ncbi:hypothetical protein [Novosphingobium sp.]|uniref:hypothetical protein n=1 Tax=Novosphingobium sp. TaxID=1874826 RepID=UPI0038B97B1B